tara:strand:- start:482 stop:991 length:510 start_codon:yes stop_codon:yes gene_type:complete
MRVNLIDKNPFITPVLDNSKVIVDNSVQNLKFNVMHEKDVEEKLIFKKYIIKGNKIETYFDREYKTSMRKSPNHYIFLSSLVNLQKMIYLLMCEKFNLSYNKKDEEKIKIWPTSVDVKMNGIVRKKKDIMQDFELISIYQISDNKYSISGNSSAESTIILRGEALVYLI